MNEGRRIDQYYHDDRENAKTNHCKSPRKLFTFTRMKCLALSRFSFVFGEEIGKHSSLSKTHPCSIENNLLLPLT